MIYKRGERYENVKCKDCGDTMRVYIPRRNMMVPMCAACHDPTGATCGGSGGSGMGHYGDDPSGGSGSWDSIVRGYEGN